MQDQPIIMMDEPSNLKPAKKKKPVKQMAAAVEVKGDLKEASNLSRRPQKGNQRGLQSDVSHRRETSEACLCCKYPTRKHRQTL